MGRPPLPIGTFGRITFVHRPSGQVQARTKFRDFDGRVRLVAKNASTRAAAERALKVELSRRQAPASGGAVNGGTRLDELADAWLAAGTGWSISTERTYRVVVERQVKPTIGRLRVQEVTPGVVSRALRTIAERSGPGAAKSARTCLSGMLSFAVQDGVLPTNPVRDAVSRAPSARRAPRALGVEQTDRLLALLADSPRAGELDLVDVVRWMLATGCRIGEALALRHGTNADGRPLIDLAARTWEIDATIVRHPGSGLMIQPRPKTKAGWRVVALPSFAVALVQRRRPVEPHGIVFAAPISRTLRDPTNVSGHLREVIDSFECEHCAGTGFQLAPDGTFVLSESGHRVRCDRGPWSWVTSHTFRKTVATRLEEAGFTPRQVADQLGHANPSMTLDVYFGRHVVSAAAATALDRPS